VDRLIAFVLLDQSIDPDMRAVAEAIRTRHPGTAVSLPDDRDAASPMIVCAGKIVVVMSMPAPAPRDDGVVGPASVTWPQARAAFDRHRAHLIVSVLGENPHPLPNTRVMTAVIGGLIAAVPGCVGVVWAGRVAGPAERWLDMSRNAFAPHPDFPFMLWIGIHPFRDQSMIGAVTYGLSSLVGREIEFEGTGADIGNIVRKVAGLAAYLIERGSAIPDGNTVGVDETERIKVRHTTSRRFADTPILLATLPGA
jgi:hypothetical protein